MKNTAPFMFCCFRRSGLFLCRKSYAITRSTSSDFLPQPLSYRQPPQQQVLQRTMPLKISAMDNITTKNLEGKINASTSPSPSIAKINPRLFPRRFFISTPPFLLLIHYMRCQKMCSKGNKAILFFAVPQSRRNAQFQRLQVRF